MDFLSNTHQKVYERVKGFLRELMGEMNLREVEEMPSFIVTAGSSNMLISVIPKDEENIFVMFIAGIATEIEKTPELMEYLLVENHNLIYGAFAIEPERGDVYYEYSIPGNDITKKSLEIAFKAMFSTADYYDDIIVGRFGGLRMLDKALMGRK